MCNVARRSMRLTCLSHLYKEGVLCKSAGIDNKWDAIFFVERCNAANVSERGRLTSARIVCEGNHTKWDIFGVCGAEALKLL